MVTKVTWFLVMGFSIFAMALTPRAGLAEEGPKEGDPCTISPGDPPDDIDEFTHLNCDPNCTCSQTFPAHTHMMPASATKDCNANGQCVLTNTTFQNVNFLGNTVQCGQKKCEFAKVTWQSARGTLKKNAQRLYGVVVVPFQQL